MGDSAAETMTVTARAVVDGKFDQAGYPYRHLAVKQVGMLGTADSQVPVVMVAVETLSRAGWELVAFTMVHRTVVAVLRRA